MSNSSWKILNKVKIIGIANVDFDGRILRCNEEFGRIQGDDPTHLVGRNVIELTSPEDRERARANLDNLSTGKVEYVIHEKTYVNRSGDSVNCRCQFLRTSEYITSFIYEFDPHDSHVERIRQLEEYIGKLLEVVSKTNGINMNIGDNNSTNVSADNQSQANVSNQWSPPQRPAAPWGLIGALLAAAALVAALVALMRS